MKVEKNQIQIYHDFFQVFFYFMNSYGIFYIGRLGRPYLDTRGIILCDWMIFPWKKNNTSSKICQWTWTKVFVFSKYDHVSYHLIQD